MGHLLHVNASPRGQASRSLRIARAFLDGCLESHPETKVDTLNLFDDPLPPCGIDAASAQGKPLAGALLETQALFDRFSSADQYLFNIPMWNFGVPYVVKHFVDIVTKPGLTFRLSPVSGYTGLLEGKRACVIYTSGVYQPGCPPQFGRDFQSTYFTNWLRFIGVKQVEEIRLNGADFSRAAGRDLSRACDEARKLGRTL